MGTLTTERERAHALHRENAQVSREATIAQKEVLSLEAKLFHSGKEVSLFFCFHDTKKGTRGSLGNFCCLVTLLFGWLVDWLFGWLVSCLVG